MGSRFILFASLSLLFVLLFVADIFLGSVMISPKVVWNAFFNIQSVENEFLIIIREFRLPKAITAIFAGAALSVAGLQMQTIFRNPLAGPYVLGITSGASLGVAILILGYSSVYSTEYISYLRNFSIAASAWMGAAFVLLLILIISNWVRDIMTILILGILFSGAISALVNILQYFSSESMLKSYVIWTMGSLSGVSVPQLQIMIPSVVFGITIAFFISAWLNILLLGEDYAKSLGVNILLVRICVFISSSILAGTITAFCGPIGFIGIAVPHLARMLFKTANHFILNAASILIGASMMLFSDIISQLPGSGISLPVNSITALIGIPLVVYIIVKKEKYSTNL
ncbi:MAG TPA: iron ABC transporter [Flavobacterium sp.]|nr:iron ABC transporter [Flavobacterium sp.]